MALQRGIRTAVQLGLLAVLGVGIAITTVEQSYAYCGGHCQAAKMCGDLVSRKGLKDKDQKRQEYQKCMRDPNSYK